MRPACAAVALLAGLASLALGCGDAHVLALEPLGPRCGDPSHAAEPARAADDLAGFVGVGLRLGYTDTPYVDRELVSRALVELGARHVAEIAGDASALGELVDTDVSALLLDATPDAVAQLPSVATPMVDLVQPLPPRVSADASPAEWSSTLEAQLDALRSALDSRSDLARAGIVAPPLPQEVLPGVQATLAAKADVSLVAGWPGARHPGDVELGRVLSVSDTSTDARPLMTTQIGYSTSTAGPARDAVSSEVVQGKYTVRLVLDLFLRGWQRVYLAQLIDWHAEDADFNDRLGLLGNDFRPKPSFTALRNLLDIVADPGPPHATGSLAFEVVGDTTDIRHVLLQNRAQRFFLVLWLEVPSSDSALERAIRLNVKTGVESVTLYQPDVSSYANRRSTSPELDLLVSDWPAVVEIATPCR